MRRPPGAGFGPGTSWFDLPLNASGLAYKERRDAGPAMPILVDCPLKSPSMHDDNHHLSIPDAQRYAVLIAPLQPTPMRRNDAFIGSLSAWTVPLTRRSLLDAPSEHFEKGG